MSNINYNALPTKGTASVPADKVLILDSQNGDVVSQQSATLFQGAQGVPGIQGPPGVGDMLKTENLSGLANYTTARTNLGLGTLATQTGTFSGTSSGTNTGDQTTIAGITGTKAQFNTAVSDGDIMFLNSADTITAVKTFSTAPVFNALPTGSAVSSASTASTIVTRDANKNIFSNNIVGDYTTTATAAGTTTLTVGSTFQQFFTGVTTQTVTLPVTSTLTLGHTFFIVNNSTGTVTVNSSGANAIITLASGTYVEVTCILTSGTTAASWNYLYNGINTATGKKITVSNSLTLAGTDATTMTFPTTSATLARTDAANTFTGTQTITQIDMGNADTSITRVSAGKIAVEGVNVGNEGILQNSQSVAYTTVLADAGKHIYHPSADTTARVFTIDSNANVPYPIGTAITFINDTSAGVVTVAITTDTLVFSGTGTTGSRTLAANGIATAVKMTSTRWMISGTGLT